LKNRFGNRLASLSPPNPALRHVSLDASAYALRNPSTRPSKKLIEDFWGVEIVRRIVARRAKTRFCIRPNFLDMRRWRPNAQRKNEVSMVKLQVTGMTCDGCAKAVERVIKAQDPRASVTVDLGSGRVEADTAAAPAALVAAIEAAGYGAKPA
jgi:copper chaperone